MWNKNLEIFCFKFFQQPTIHQPPFENFLHILTIIPRFCNVLKEFITGSQFILITHNKRTMNLADALYGITMAQTGISKIVSVRFADKKARDKEEVLV